MNPHDSDENESAESGSGSSSPKKRGIMLGGTGALVAAALVAIVVFVTGGSGEQPKNVAAESRSTGTSALSVTLGPTTTAAEDQGQPPGTVRLPGGNTAELVKKEITENGTLPIPKDLDKAAWWGAGLGESGAMLLSGHINWNGERGPFHALLNIQPGQKVTVIDKSGGKWVYQVHDVRKISKEELPSVAPELFGQDGEHRLVLVTCGGEFVGGETGYASNIIAIADLVSSPQ